MRRTFYPNENEVNKLFELRKQVMELGNEMLKERLPMKMDDASEFLKPFVKIEKQIKKIIEVNRGLINTGKNGKNN